jgi:hypothetical protein
MAVELWPDVCSTEGEGEGKGAVHNQSAYLLPQTVVLYPIIVCRHSNAAHRTKHKLRGPENASGTSKCRRQRQPPDAYAARCDYSHAGYVIVRATIRYSKRTHA